MVSTLGKTMTTGFALVAVAALLAGCAGSTTPAATGTSTDGADDTPVTLTFVGYGGGGQDAQIEAWQVPYTEAHPNVTFVNTSPPDVAQVKAQVNAGAVQWDVVATAPYAAAQNCDTLFEELDLSGVDESDLIEGTVGKCYIGNWINATPIAYRTEVFGASKAEAMAKKFSIPETVRLPIDPSFASAINVGGAESVEIPEFEAFAGRILR